MLAPVQIDGYFPDLPLRVFSALSSLVCQLEVLTLSTTGPERIMELVGTDKVPKLSKLKQLTINVSSHVRDTVLGVTPILRTCPDLHKFVLMLYHGKYILFPQRYSLEKDANLNVKCSLENLRAEELLGYKGRSSEDEVIFFFLENASRVEKIVVDPRKQNPLLPLHDLDEEQAARTSPTQRL